MFPLDQVTGFEWDDGNQWKNEAKHGVSQSEAEQTFLNDPLLVLADMAHSQFEPRYHALGRTDDGRYLHVTFTVREAGTLIRVISARPMHRKERERYEEEA